MSLLCKGLAAIPAERLWVSSDCGLMTRGWGEVRDSLHNVVEVTRQLRTELDRD